MEVKEFVRGLNRDEKINLFEYLKNDLNNQTDLKKLKATINKEQTILCPHCSSKDLYGHGEYRGRKRYKCKSCLKTFNDFTGTAISGIKKTIEFQEYIDLIPDNYSLRKASKKLGLNIKTVFDWRHKILSSLKTMNGQHFSGIVECDDKQLDINKKGSRSLDRMPYKRPSDRTTKRGISNDKVSIMVATDRNTHPTMQVAKVGRIDCDSIDKTLGNFVQKETILCSDAHPSIIAWAKDKQLEHHTFIASKNQHIKDKCYHIQHVNSIDNLYERWIMRFYGVATKYLEQYLNWFVFLEKTKNAINPIQDLHKNLVSNTNAINHYKSIETRYEKLIFLQSS